MDDLEGRGYEEQEEEEHDSFESSVRIEISRLSLFTHHGVTEAEQQAGQRLVFDIAFEVEDCDATVTDRIDERFSAANVVVRATKPEPPMPLPVEEVSVEVER
jgi:7,8-dihydroneopterin aldolase/epimerase/oxygenase